MASSVVLEDVPIQTHEHRLRKRKIYYNFSTVTVVYCADCKEKIKSKIQNMYLENKEIQKRNTKCPISVTDNTEFS